jgi:upstream activation factor subunit UAF30
MVFGLFKKKKTTRKKTVKKKAVRKVKRKKIVKKKTAKRKVTKRKTVKKAKRKTTKRKGGKKPAFGGYKIVPDAKLGVIIGNKPLPPSQMTKKIWQYIKKNKLSNR